MIISYLCFQCSSISLEVQVTFSTNDNSKYFREKCCKNIINRVDISGMK